MSDMWKLSLSAVGIPWTSQRTSAKLMGKSDWEIGKLLGISESTVHKHIEDAKRRFGVSTRIQLVVRSLADARLNFSDILKA